VWLWNFRWQVVDLFHFKNDTTPFATDFTVQPNINTQGPPQISDIEDDASMASLKSRSFNQPGLKSSGGSMTKNHSADNLIKLSESGNASGNVKPTEAKSKNFNDFSESDDSDANISMGAVERELNLSKTALTNPILFDYEKYINNKNAVEKPTATIKLAHHDSKVNMNSTKALDSLVLNLKTTQTSKSNPNKVDNVNRTPSGSLSADSVPSTKSDQNVNAPKAVNSLVLNYEKTTKSNTNTGNVKTFENSAPMKQHKISNDDSAPSKTPSLNALVLNMKDNSKSKPIVVDGKGASGTSTMNLLNMKGDSKTSKSKQSLADDSPSGALGTMAPTLNSLVLNMKNGPSASKSKQSLADDSGVGSLGSTVDKTKKNQKSIQSISSNIDELVQSMSPKKNTWDRIKDQSDVSTQSDGSKSEKLIFNSSNKQPNQTKTQNDLMNTIVSTFNPKKDPKQIKGIKQLIEDIKETKQKKMPPQTPSKESYLDFKSVSPKPNKGYSQLTGGLTRTTSQGQVNNSNPGESVNSSPKSAKGFSYLSGSLKNVSNQHVTGLKELIDGLKSPSKPLSPNDYSAENDNEFSDYEESMELAIDIEPPPDFKKTDRVDKKPSFRDDGNTSDSEIFMHNLNVLSKAHRQKSTSDKNLKMLNQQFDQAQNEIVRLTALLQDMTRQKTDLDFKNMSLSNQIKILGEEKGRLENELRKSEQKLIDREKSYYESMNSSNKTDPTAKANVNEIINLRKEIISLKEEKSKADGKLTLLQASTKSTTGVNVVGSSQLMTTLGEQNDKLSIEIKALKQQIEELNKDRNSLSQYKEQLTNRLDESEMNVNMHQEALEKAVMQYSMEKATMKEEIGRLKAEIHEVTESKKKLIDEIQRLQMTAKDCKHEIDLLLREKASLEQLLEKERNEKDGVRTRYDADSYTHKEHHIQLIEKLSANEAKLQTLETEYSIAKNALQEKQNQVSELKDELIKLKVEFNLLENKLASEKEERIRVASKNETAEERLRTVVEENSSLRKQHQDYVESQKIDKLNTVSLASLERKKIESENEKNLLKQDLNILNQRLQNAELVLNNQKNLRVSKPEFQTGYLASAKAQG
jgi:hypothetical protein